MEALKEKQEEKYNKRWVPYQWPWTDKYGNNITSIKEWLISRKFTVSYLVIAWTILAIFGYAARRNCDGPWEIQFMCEMTMWMEQFRTDFWHFLMTCFTTAWFHNDPQHIWFVTLFGFLFPVQSFEEQHGTWNTIKLYFASYLFIGLYTGSLFNFLQLYWPDTHFVSNGFNRTWMGGSVGIFAIIGSLSYFSSKKWFLWAMVTVFEVFNMTVIGNNVHISFIHISCASFGWVYSWVWDTYFLQKKKLATQTA
ncbi:rhomboid family intramembrane serine protease [Reichenbachiella ulvae]|uniref:Rhomboid family intramembrane serine protease n=1 Tax=Reichenbachiella ulvae TaxID=2980104 RepID=A0ABT3CYH1_9BACT|nr:rhomboid family intramembrane serine protease [Reichenbachiella ulvae]MCV9388598.1 rhomboid family intramembrane serine protease [Reichenbachiella ulvae]